MNVPMGKEEYIMPFTLLTNWTRYKRRSDNVTVEARLIKEDAIKMMEIREERVDNVSCPVCNTILTTRNGRHFPNFILEPGVFHERHRALDIN